MDIQAIRALVSQGDLAKALMSMISLLERDSRFKDNLLRALRVAEANYNAVRQQELKGILSFQEAQREYSRVTDTLLSVLDDVEAGRVPATAIPPARRYAWIYVAAGALGVVLIALAVWKFRHSDTASACPKFEEEKTFHILVLPFDNLATQEAKPELRIKDDIRSLTSKAGIPVEVQIREKDTQKVLSNAQLKNCGNVDLVVFGQYRAFEKRDSILVKMNFQFLKDQSARIVDGPFRPAADITGVQVERDLEDAILSLCGRIAMSEKKWPFAKRWMDKIKEKTGEEQSMSDWLDKHVR